MNNRWRMNRIGFVNFWLYDEEEFEFCDGRLLLRGQNGSGKSITTQSFIPFVLDGDRTPSRLDPFGSSDRRMEYYFLGEEGKDEATGYLFLEFKREQGEEYRTIGIGQRAKRGKPMDFWGFLVLDGQRIGYDLFLYKEVGSTKIPLDKREMKTRLGENNLFTDSQKEYKSLVNQYVFGFPREEQYEQFIRLLVKVRAPKLSKEFKPTRVYDILNESLQTLSDEDLRTMVDAMEKMDEIQDSLEMLNRAFSDVKIIRTEYVRYNQYMLAKKAQAYLNKKDEADEAKRLYEKMQAERESLAQELREIRNRLEEISVREKGIDTEIDGLLDSDIQETDRKLELVKREKEELLEKINKLNTRIDEQKAKIYQKEQQIKELKRSVEAYQEQLADQKREMGDQQETLRWELHDEVIRILEREYVEEDEEISQQISIYKKYLEECRRIIADYEVIAGSYDEAARMLEEELRRRAEKERSLSEAEQGVLCSQDHWIEQLYAVAGSAGYWKPQERVLKEAEEQIREYCDIVDAGRIQELLRTDYDRQRELYLDRLREAAQAIDECRKSLKAVKEELREIESREEIEPERKESVVHSRQKLKEAGIAAVPFYQTVEFADGLSDRECAQIEAQLESMGLLDALVVSETDWKELAETFPEFLDTVICISCEGTSGFSKLKASENLECGLKESVNRILSTIYEQPETANGMYLGSQGQFRQGVLAGRSEKTEAEFLGCLARKRKREQKIIALRAEIQRGEQELGELSEGRKRVETEFLELESEYRAVPGFDELNRSLTFQKECSLELQQASTACQKAEQKEAALAKKKQAQYQMLLQACKPFPYGRTVKEFDEALEALEECRNLWGFCKGLLLKLQAEREREVAQQEYLSYHEQELDAAFFEVRSCNMKIRQYDTQISQYEEYLNSPEIVEKTRRLQKLREERAMLWRKKDELRDQNSRTDERLKHIVSVEPKEKQQLQQFLSEETLLCKYFAEELSLKLLMENDALTLTEAAKEAVKLLRDSDRNREHGDMMKSLFQVYQQHNGSLTNYGTALEECFEAAEDLSGTGPDFQPLRKRVRVVSAWNGKKVYLEEFFRILKAAIEETELLIQKKDRELFEDMLSQTISQQLTDRIAESRSWVKDMSTLMKELDTSMGLSFSLEWKPKSAENDAELDTMELEHILLRDRELLTIEDIEKVAGHFRSKIRMEKMKLEESGGLINYMELIRDALDYRKWFEFRMFCRRGEENKKPLTNAAFNRFSGGEKAMAMYVPLFAAVNAQYKKAGNHDHPRIIALDEAFAGVDDKNISSMFELVQKMDFDYIMNSQSLWGCYETVKGIKIAELHRPMNSQVVSVIRYLWNGHERLLDVQ